MGNHESRDTPHGPAGTGDASPGGQQATPAGEQGGQGGIPDADAGMDREVGDINDPDDDAALPGRMGGGLAGG